MTIILERGRILSLSLIVTLLSTECPVCYELVGDEVNLLREMRDNLTTLVDLLEAQDMNDELGSFHTRLDLVQANTGILLDFVGEEIYVKHTDDDYACKRDIHYKKGLFPGLKSIFRFH